MMFIRWACLLPVLLFSGIVHAVQLPTTYTLSAEDLIRVRASTNENRSTVVEWNGQVLSYKPGDVPTVLFHVQGMNIARAKKLADGGYDLLTREVQLYLNATTNEVLHVWHNPYSGQDVPAATAYQARYQPGGTYTFQLSIPLAYPNPLNPTGDPSSPLYPYSGPTQAKYSAIESFTFTFSGAEFISGVNSIPSTQVYWTRTSPLLPFMATPATNVSLLFVASGSKVEGGWQKLSSAAVRDIIATNLTAYKDAPTERVTLGGGVSSWSYFAQPAVFQAYLNGSTFPLPDLV
ncbi:hypothetical protein DXG01_002362 [Tephrocybe rancida]|nr:hypothetical protein DXG01_002362 [Tephrocybe rancida]